MDEITNTFEDLPVPKRTLYCYMANLWVFILEKVRLGSVERNTPEKIQTITKWVEMVNNLGVDYIANSVSIDKSRFHATLRRSQCWALKEGSTNVKVLTYLINNLHATLFNSVMSTAAAS
jgi:hypothetical protein